MNAGKTCEMPDLADTTKDVSFLTTLQIHYYKELLHILTLRWLQDKLLTKNLNAEVVIDRYTHTHMKVPNMDSTFSRTPLNDPPPRIALTFNRFY